MRSRDSWKFLQNPQFSEELRILGQLLLCTWNLQFQSLIDYDRNPVFTIHSTAMHEIQKTHTVLLEFKRLLM